MAEGVDCATIAATLGKDLKEVKDILQRNDITTQDQAVVEVDKFFNGSGVFKNRDTEWTSNKKPTKARRADDEQPGSRAEERRPPSRGSRPKGDDADGGGKGGGGKGERGRGKGDGERSRGGRGGRGRDGEDRERPPRPPRGDKPTENGSPAPTAPPPSAASKPSNPSPAPVVPKPAPVGNKWGQEKNWAEEFQPSPSPAPPAKAEAVAPEEGSSSTPGMRERGGKGRGGKAERKSKGEGGEDGSRGRGRGRKGSATPSPTGDAAAQPDSNGGSSVPKVDSRSDLTADLQSVMAPDASLSTVSSLPLPKADSADGPLPLMTSLPTPADGLLGPMPAGLSAAPAAGASTTMLMDPAILGMSGAPNPVGALPGATVADTTVTAGVIMPTQLPGNSSKLQFGFGDTSACGSNGGVAAAAPAGAPGGLQKMPDFGLGQLSSELFDSNVSPLGAASGSLPLPASLKTALPSAGATALPGFDGSAPEAASSIGTSPADKMLATGLEKLNLEAVAGGAADDNPALGSLPPALSGIMPLAPAAAGKGARGPPGVGRPPAGSVVPLAGAAPLGPTYLPPTGSYSEPSSVGTPPPLDEPRGGGGGGAAGGAAPPSSGAMPPGNIAMGMPGAVHGYEVHAGTAAAPAGMAARQPGADKDGDRRGKQKKGKGARGDRSGDRNPGGGGPGGGMPPAMHGGGEMGMVPPGMGIAVGNGSMGAGLGGSQPSRAGGPPGMMQPAYGGQQPYAYSMVAPVMASPHYAGYGGMPHGFGGGMYQVAPGMPPGNINMYAPSHSNYVAQQQQYVQQQQYLSQQSGSGPAGGYVQPYPAQQQMAAMSGGGMAPGFSSGTNFGGYEDAPSDYNAPPGHGYYGHRHP